MNLRRFLLLLNLAVVAGACEDENDLREQPKPPAQVLPPSGYSHGDAGTPASVTTWQANGFTTVTTWDTGIRNGPPPLTGDVEKVSQALIGQGMRSCAVQPEQTHGEVVINKLRGWWEETPGNIDQCLILQTAGQWDICSPTHHWYDGQMLNDNIRRAVGFAYDKRCLKVQLFSEWMYGGTVTEYKTCAAAGVYNNLFAEPPQTTSSIKLHYYACPNYPNCP